MQYRVTVNIRKKGEGYMDGIELKTEHHDSIEELALKVTEFIVDTLYDAEEGEDE